MSLTPSDTAKLLHISPSHLRALTRSGKISASHKTPGGHNRYTVADVQRAQAVLGKSNGLELLEEEAWSMTMEETRRAVARLSEFSQLSRELLILRDRYENAFINSIELPYEIYRQVKRLIEAGELLLKEQDNGRIESRTQVVSHLQKMKRSISYSYLAGEKQLIEIIKLLKQADPAWFVISNHQSYYHIGLEDRTAVESTLSDLIINIEKTLIGPKIMPHINKIELAITDELKIRSRTSIAHH